MSSDRQVKDRFELINKEVRLADIATVVKGGLGKPENQKALPPYMFYDVEGSDLFERICKVPEYYLTRAEHSILACESDTIASLLPSDAVVAELGSGSSTKTRLLLEAFLRKNNSLQYIPIDISPSILIESSETLLSLYKNLSVMAIVGEYHDGVKELRKLTKDRTKLLLWLGSSAGNLTRLDTIDFVRELRKELQDENEMFLIGLDLQKDIGILEAAYNDAEGVTAEFNLNILKRMNQTLGADFDLSKFTHHAPYNTVENRIEMNLYSKEDQTVTIKDIPDFQVNFKKGERIHTENSHKYSLSEIETLAKETDFTIIRQWFDDEKRFSLSLFAPNQPKQKIETRITEKLKASWKTAEMVFGLLNEDAGAFFQKPISLRHPFIFYLGHLSAFENNQVMRLLLHKETGKEAPEGHKCEFSLFDDMFERGLDPDVDEPNKCHKHSKAPNQWPSISAIKEYRNYVQETIVKNIGEVLAMSKNGPVLSQRGKVFNMCIEHTLMHAETLLYMFQVLCQDFKVRPQEFPEYDFRRCPLIESERAPILIPTGNTKLGANFSNVEFGWDNEFPLQLVHVPAFKVDPLPVTNGQFFEFLSSGAYDQPTHWSQQDWDWKVSTSIQHPSFWKKDDDGKWFVQTIFDKIEFEKAADWPVYVSKAEANAYAKWKGKRLLSEPEFQRAAYAVNPILLPEHVEADASRPYPWGWESPKGGKHGNFGYVNWSPVPVGVYPEGRSSFGVYDLIGNGWEWTSSIFEGFPGFEPYITTYPGYSSDFFDNKHFVLKGASFATDGSLIRPSLRNFFQAHYQYVFAKFRLASAP